jgi:1-acyl-sn-glycerol-3-phosphate acyltransferase
MSLQGLWQIVASWAFTIAFGLCASAVTLLTLGRFARRLTPWLLRLWGQTMLKISRITYETQGTEHLLQDGMKVVSFNHGSLIDAYLVTAIMPPASVAAIKREALYYPVVGITLYLLGFLLIDRGSSGRSRRVMDRAAARMADEKLAVFLAPEGTRHPTAELLPFKKGALHLAVASQAPIVPMLIDGAFELHGPGRLTSIPGHVIIRFLPARPTAGLTAESVGSETEALRAHYLSELARLRADRISSGLGLLPAQASALGPERRARQE